MTDDEERQLRQELLAVELSLKRKQEFWETPRNIAILVGVTALIAARDRLLARPRIHGTACADRQAGRHIWWFGEVRGDEFIDVVQTAGIVAIAAMLAYVIARLERAVTTAAEMIKGSLGDVMKTQNQLQQNVRRVWERIDLIESKQGNDAQQNDRAALGEWVGRAWQHIEKVEARLEAIEKGEPRPEGTRPTDPPLGVDHKPTGE